MRTLTLVMATCGLLVAAATPSFAADKTMTQQERMKSCNAEAAGKGLKADARKSFMSTCLKGATTAAAGSTAASSSKEKTCTTEADQRKLAGAARTSFLKKCTTG